MFRAHEWGDADKSETFDFGPVVSYAAPFERPIGGKGELVLPFGAEGDLVVETSTARIYRDLEIPHIRLADWLSQN